MKKDVLAEANKSFTAESGAGVYIIPARDVLFTKTVFSHEKEALTDELAVEIEATVTTLSYTSDALVPWLGCFCRSTASGIHVDRRSSTDTFGT